MACGRTAWLVIAPVPATVANVSAARMTNLFVVLSVSSNFVCRVVSRFTDHADLIRPARARLGRADRARSGMHGGLSISRDGIRVPCYDAATA